MWNVNIRILLLVELEFFGFFLSKVFVVVIWVYFWDDDFIDQELGKVYLLFCIVFCINCDKVNEKVGIVLI